MWDAFARAAPPDLAQRRGIRVMRAGGALPTPVAGADVPALNRALGSGPERTGDEAALAEMLAAMGAVGPATGAPGAR